MIRKTAMAVIFLATVTSATAGAQGNGTNNSLQNRVAALEAAVARLETVVGALQSTLDGLLERLTALQDALKDEGVSRAKGDADTLRAAKNYADQADTASAAELRSYVAESDALTLSSANLYTDEALSRRLVFATSTTISSSFGSLTGADSACQALASAAGLPGTYKAWLSDSTGSPSTRFYRAAGDYKLVDGTLIAHGWADLTDGSLNAPISLDEHGNPANANDNYVWTNTTSAGIPASGDSCSNWSSTSTVFTTVGTTLQSDSGWTQASNAVCGGGRVGRMLYCFQQ